MGHTASDDASTLDELRRRLEPALAGEAVLDLTEESGGRTVALPDGTAVVLATSGSTSGTGHRVALSADALLASARATHARLGGPGTWILALDPRHVAGLQVLVRGIVAGSSPVVAAASPFDPHALAAAADAVPGDGPLYTSLVPTQLVRALAAGRDVVDPLRRLDAILLGGAAAPSDLLARAADAGLRVVTTYGMTETCGGCVYDGVPLDGVDVAVDAAGRISIGGPTLALGYVGGDDAAAATRSSFSDGRFRTSDRGEYADGVLRVLGRVDDVVVTGGVNVDPHVVEDALAGDDAVGHVAVVGVPDPEWGAVLVACVVPARGPAATGPAATGPDAAELLASLRRRAAAALSPAHAPRHVVVLDVLPERGPGKVDRRALAALAAARLAEGRR
ncbi:O-succinylbenzoic acid--CoA ligase [Beutenbergia cavernae DSM 12333]|uniref:O-succinylbenzoic acid--CoA ligase n=1 Tax=Beutenbergia cavernae (strain ATCC BAA-8 / DSM 12333 / CCUG 43141 / JCM 11478 / NBRC 16432 / NCIMB 13614 / HKI 0122) TaxID=471853 RepID=C5C181_BEUC1|nr:AMP-binding protein [Beutenbergia cavernae]ACQ81491.1 O-succinylbenzoic acid--CoA ligase [Beutenbergia cavernae DSM 12333]